MAKDNSSKKSSKSRINEQGESRGRASDKKLVRNQGRTRRRITDSDGNGGKGGNKDSKN